jgi:hypothetical protein
MEMTVEVEGAGHMYRCACCNLSASLQVPYLMPRSSTLTCAQEFMTWR